MNIIKRFSFITGIFVLLSLVFNIPVNAFNGAILKGIEIDSPDNQNYRIIIKTDKDVPVKKFITDSNKVVIDLENIKPANFVNTLYNNATEIDHIIIQPFSGNRLRIFLQGTNIAAGKIILDTRDEALSFINKEEAAKTESVEKVAKPIQNLETIETATPVKIKETQQGTEIIKTLETKGIAKTSESPVQPATDETASNSTAPIFIDLSDKSVDKIKAVKAVEAAEAMESRTNESPIKTLDNYEEVSKNNFETVQDAVNSDSSINQFFEASIFDWVLRFIMLIAIIITGIKFFTKPKNIEINLSSEKMKSREMEEVSLLRAAESRKELLTKSLGLTPASKKPINASISQYGIREYQNSQYPPKKMTTSYSYPEKTDRPVRPEVRQSKQSAQTVVKTPNAAKITQKQTQQAKENFDSAKFLETMASIYQKSGRDDLATGIRQNLIKKQIV